MDHSLQKAAQRKAGIAARRALSAAHVKVDVRFRTKDDYAVIAMVRQGLGISISDFFHSQLFDESNLEP